MKSLVETSNEAFELVRQLIETQSASRHLSILKGGILWKLKAGNLYKKAFGEGVDTWEEFLRSPEIALATSEANRSMQLYEYFVLRYKLSEEELKEVPLKSLHYLLPRLKSGEIAKDDVPELLESAKSLTFNQFKEQVFDKKNVNEESRTYSYSVMRRCKQTGNLSKVLSISEEEIRKLFPHIDNA